MSSLSPYSANKAVDPSERLLISRSERKKQRLTAAGPGKRRIKADGNGGGGATAGAAIEAKAMEEIGVKEDILLARLWSSLCVCV